MDQTVVRDMQRVAAYVAAADRITVLTGAGISTESGIPDYRGPNGVWTTNPAAMRQVNIRDYLEDPQVRRDAWQERLHHPAWTATPSAGHRALVELERAGKLRALITQNIDGLHQVAGSSPDAVLELHGTIHVAGCLECGHRTPMQEQLDRVRAGEPDPPCTECGGIQRSATIAFGPIARPQRPRGRAGGLAPVRPVHRGRDVAHGAAGRLALRLRAAGRRSTGDRERGGDTAGRSSECRPAGVDR